MSIGPARLRPALRTWAIVALLGGASPCVAQETPAAARKPVATNHQLLRKYVWSTLGLKGAIHATLASGLEQWRGSPPEWGQGSTGYAKRWASAFAESAVGDTTTYAVARLFHHDPSFTRCECTGMARRLRHAAGAPFVARTRRGRRVLSPATLAGLAAANIVPASTWYPAPQGARGGLKHAASGVAGKIGVDIVREFLRRR